MYRGKGSNLHAQCAPDPKSGVSTNSTTAAFNYNKFFNLLLIKNIFYH